MACYNIVAQTSENTVVTEYEPVKRKSESYQSETELEAEFIRMLSEQGYEYLQVGTESELLANLRKQISKLNGYEFSDSEWDLFLRNSVANPNEHIEEKTKKIQEDYIQVLKRDDGSSKNIMLIDKKNIHNNYLQVINQYKQGVSDGAAYDNRYDVTILVNGIPMVHIELKRRGVPIREAFNQIERYQRDSFWSGCGLYEYIQIFVISNGTDTKYYSNSTRINHIKDLGRSRKAVTSNSFEFTSHWADSNNRIIPDLIDFTRTFFARHTILNILTKYCVYTVDNLLLIMRPYQITATERILQKVNISENYKQYGSIAGGGFIWHTTGSGKTLTSFKTARIASQLSYIDKVLFVVDRKDLDYQTMKEYDKFEKGAANSNSSTAILKRQLENDDCKIIITTIQKLSIFIKKNANHPVYQKRVILIFDECHRSQFGEMHMAVTKNFKKYNIFGFTGTPIFACNMGTLGRTPLLTTEQTFGECLHCYTIVDAINDGNVLPFKVDYIKTMDEETNIDEEDVWDIDREAAYLDEKRIALITKYILEHFNKKTYRNTKSYTKGNKTLNGFNSLFAVSSINAAKLYYTEFKKQMSEDPSNALKIAVIYSYGANEELNGIIDEENPEDTSALDAPSREFLEKAISDYNDMFNTNFSTDGDRFQNYYKDVSNRMKNKELDLLIVVNMFLTGFDATTLNTLWVDKKLRQHGLIQAFSRTNRILNDVKKFGNIVCFRNLQNQVDEAIALFGDKNANGIVLLGTFEDYFYGYNDDDGHHDGYLDMLKKLITEFPLSEPSIIGEAKQKEFIGQFGAILRIRNILSSFDKFEEKDPLPERDLQDYLGRYQDLRDEWKRKRVTMESTNVNDDIVFEIELIKQIEVNIDYILHLVGKYHDSHKTDEEILINIMKAVESAPELRSKIQLIKTFIEGLETEEDIVSAWKSFISTQKETELSQIIKEENLNEKKTRELVEESLRIGEVKTTGVAIDEILPPISRFGQSNRLAKKQNVIAKIQGFFETFKGI